jgi:hypothetical protein
MDLKSSGADSVSGSRDRGLRKATSILESCTQGSVAQAGGLIDASHQINYVK